MEFCGEGEIYFQRGDTSKSTQLLSYNHHSK